MKDKIRLLMAFLVVSAASLGADEARFHVTKMPSADFKQKEDETLKAKTDDVEIDLNTNRLIAKNGINLKYGSLELKAFDVTRDIQQNKVFANGNLISLFSSATGDLVLESQKGGEVSLNGDEGVFYDNFGFLEVGKVTGAEKPNDRIYFGGDTIIYKNDKVNIKKGWLTTDYNILKTKKPKDAGYHLLSEDVLIEPDKQITLKKSMLYRKDKKQLPFAFPWFRSNIRKGSKIPLFPEWGTNTYYGWNTSVGVLYGNKGDKFVGGIAPKFGDRMGFLIGRWENWYKTDRFGTAKLNIEDWLIWSKERKTNLNKITDQGQKIDVEERKKRYKVNYAHEYSGEYGHLNFNATRGTYNTIKRLDDIIVDYTINGKFKGNDRPKLTKSIGFYSLDSDLKNLGEDKDITFKGKLKLTDNKKAYGLMVYDELSDIAYGSSVDNDLLSQFSLYKDNSNYKVGGYYNYLYDIDPGSNSNDKQSRAEDFGFEYFDKNKKIGFSYDEKNGDKFRPLNLWERDPSNEGKVEYSSLYKDFKYSYVPTTVKEYSKYDSKNLKIQLGEYDVAKGYKLTPGFDYSFYERELDMANDTSRSQVSLPRDREYNRFENNIYEKFSERKGYLTFFNNNTKFNVAVGKTKQEIHDREGIYVPNKYAKYINYSDFYEVSGQRDNISLAKFGKLSLFGDLRYDNYDKGNNPFSNQEATGKDATLRKQIKVTHNIDLYDYKDKKVNNELTLFYQDYNYMSKNVKYGNLTKNQGKFVRLANKDNVYQVVDTITTEFGETQTKLTTDYKRTENAGTKHLNKEIINTKIDLKFNDTNKLVLKYGNDKRYTDKTASGKNYNDLTYGNYGFEYYIDKHGFSYDNKTINSKVRDLNPILNTYNGTVYNDNANEKIKQNSFGYNYRGKNNNISLGYSEGKDKRYNLTKNQDEINVKNQIYSARYSYKKDNIQHDISGKYEIYRHKEDSAKTMIGNRKYNLRNSDIISLDYEYKNMNFTNEELEKYAQSEYNKKADSLTPEELIKIKQILENRDKNATEFKLDNDIYKQFDSLSDSKLNLKLNVMFQKNEARYKITGDYWQSLEKIQAGAFYAYNRTGIGYQVEENASWSNKKWGRDNRKHKISVVTKIGKPSEGWSVKAYAKFNEDLRKKLNNDKRSLDGLGVEVGKEMGYYKWSVAFERKYVLSARDYEWSAALQFTLLTFPETPIFGAGAKTDTKKHTSPETTLFKGLDVKKVIE